MEKGCLKRIVRLAASSLSKIGEAICKTAKEQPLRFASVFIIVGITTWGMNNWAEMRSRTDASGPAQETISAEEEKDAVIMRIYKDEKTMTRATTSASTTTTSTTSTCTTMQETTEYTTTMCTTTTEVATTELIIETEEDIQAETEYISESVEVEDESVGYTDNTGVGQYGYAIDSAEYIYLAQVIEHEGANCSLETKERIGICLLNRTFAPGFCDSVCANKEAPGQYFSGWYDYTDESATIAENLIAAYNSGAEYWSQFCADRYLTSDTVYQRNDYAVPGTQEVYRETASTSGGYTFTLVYSR
ncbi:MAG: hypothetical protein J6J36_07150 [Clostridia bacterium]|nr:hypothetical protein [Clostridia bacterium]